MLEDGGQQELGQAGLGGQAAHAGDVEMRRFRAQQEFGVQVDARFESPAGVETQRDPRILFTLHVGVHPQSYDHVVVICQIHGAHRHGLHRLFRLAAQHGGGVEADLRPRRWRSGLGVRVGVGADVVVERREQVGVAEALDDHAVDRLSFGDDPDDRADADRRVAARPEMELVRRVGLALGGDDASYGLVHAAFLAVEGILESTETSNIEAEPSFTVGLSMSDVRCSP